MWERYLYRNRVAVVTGSHGNSSDNGNYSNKCKNINDFSSFNKMGFRETGWGDTDWIDLAEDKD
jgi:hypothetical protein